MHLGCNWVMATPAKSIRLIRDEKDFNAMFSPITRCLAGAFLWRVDTDPPHLPVYRNLWLIRYN